MAGFAGMLFGSAVIVWISSLLVHFIAKKIYKKLIFDKISALNVALTICLILNASSFVYLLVNIKHDSSQSPKMLTTNAVPPAAINWGTFQPDDKSYAVSVPYGSNDGVDMREIDCAQHCHGYPDITLQDLYSNLPVGDYHLMTVYSVPFLKLLEGHFYEISRYHQVSSEKFTDTNKHLLYIYDAMKKTIVGNNTPKFSRAIIHESKPDVYADGYLDYLYLVDGDNGGSHFSVWEMGRIFIRGDDVYILKNSDTNFDLLLTNIDDYKKFVNSFSTNISAP